MNKPRVLLVCDGTSWFVRHVHQTEHDLVYGQMVYRCDEPLGGPYGTLPAALRHFNRIVNQLRRERSR